MPRLYSLLGALRVPQYSTHVHAVLAEVNVTTKVSSAVKVAPVERL